MKHLIVRTFAVALIVATLAACGSAGAAPAAAPPPVDEATATQIAANALDGYNAGDYATWARDWSALMTGAIKEADFLAFRAQLMPKTGRYVAIESVAYQQPKPGIHRYTFTVRFEKLTGSVWFGWLDGSPKIEGVKFE